MFVQVIHGRVRDADRLRRQADRWQRELKPGARGYLGSTGGVAEDGEAVVLARFESEEAARRNSDRPEQGEWWQETESCFEGEVSFHDTTDVDLVQGGGSDDAGFVQVMHGRATDMERIKALNVQMDEWIKRYRPDHLGAIMAWQKDGSFFRFIYFASEAEARAGERHMDIDLPEEARELLEEWRSLTPDISFIDLKDPWLESA
jgi:hypothetical protein